MCVRACARACDSYALCTYVSVCMCVCVYTYSCVRLVCPMYTRERVYACACSWAHSPSHARSHVRVVTVVASTFLAK